MFVSLHNSLEGNSLEGPKDAMHFANPVVPIEPGGPDPIADHAVCATARIEAAPGPLTSAFNSIQSALG
jgi:hypothetical protein